MRTKRKIKTYEQVHEAIRQQDIVVTHRQHGFTVFNQEVVSPHLVITYCHEGSARGIYDLRERTYGKGEPFVVMPDHLVNQLWCSDDFVFSRIVVSADLLADLLAAVTTDDATQSGKRSSFAPIGPVCRLTDEQAERLLAMADLLEAIARQEVKDSGQQRQILTAQLAVAYRLLMLYLSEQPSEEPQHRHAQLFDRFSRLVVEHWRESREVQYYAEFFDLTPKYFAKLIRQETGGLSPTYIIEQYVAAQAKHFIAIHPTWPFSEVAKALGFEEPPSFHRYFKRVTGITAQTYRESLNNI